MAKLKINFTQLYKNLDIDLDVVLEQTAQDIVTITQQLAPVDTGDLRDSYQFEKVEVGTYRIGSNPKWGAYRRPHPTFYAPFVEYGTSNSPRQPHFVPAFQQALPTFQARLAEFLQKKAGS